MSIILDKTNFVDYNRQMINETLLKEILNDWSFWNKPITKSIARKISLPNQLNNDIALIIQGVRRCGKSTLLTQIPNHYQLNLNHCFFCNFEDPRLLEDLDYNLLSQIVSVAKKEIPSTETCYFFFDEIQNVKHWEKWLHTELERPKQNCFIITGSNSSLLGGEFATALTGRHITLELFPFSFIEYQELNSNKTLEDYFKMGGFPRATTISEPYKLLQEYFSDIIYRDVIKKTNIRMPNTIMQVAKIAFDSCGSELSFRRIAATIGLTVDTVKSYLEALEKAYLLFQCPYFSFSEQQQSIRNKKYYPIDPGLRFAVTNTIGRDLGKSLENLVFLRLKQKYKQVYYFNEDNKGEIDFIVIDGTQIIPYQVTLEHVAPRHEKALEHFYKKYPTARDPIFITTQNAKQFI